MVQLTSYPLAVILLVITMLSWGSWANTQKLTSGKQWPFQLFYWDYSIGVIIMSLLFGFTIGTLGDTGRSFTEDLLQASTTALFYAFIGGVVFNLANILIVAAIDLAGMAIAFPIGIGIALVEGTIINYINSPVGNPILIFSGMSCIVIAIIIDALAYKRLPQKEDTNFSKGIIISVIGGLLMGLFFYLLQVALASSFENPEAGKMEPFAAAFIFSIGIFISNFIWNTWAMKKPFKGPKVNYSDYFKGGFKIHIVGILGGIIWCTGNVLANYTSEVAGGAIAYGLGQGATMVASIWGVFVWKEFKDAPKGTNTLLFFMFLFFIIGLSLLISARLT
ncbi:multidrug DMT transporter permease [Flammeovirga yaeyamensis]|uniref:Multidrug DMT transporter permease n=1 Tax=Flammeovirga yaeyamensis TaxID=367791 RepID=A0AAX1NBL5_9BACT|nr:GRP family sugar transporter [Flammeovirga yaeyamensis]MBB3697184.1 glucose uptake protein [Flammeovirga yaeyamensis]NMF33844.1 multidrug DMT transporter permease [Flammeovirga yaeyamensis]QWG04894.1 multidrug DMT transporter permease [Flammeovirga yaeyamensis]